MKMRHAAKAKTAATPPVDQSVPTMQVAAVVKDGRVQAEAFARQPRKLRILLDNAIEKAKQADKGAFKDLWPYLLAMLRLIRAFCSGKYKKNPLGEPDLDYRRHCLLCVTVRFDPGLSSRDRLS